MVETKVSRVYVVSGAERFIQGVISLTDLIEFVVQLATTPARSEKEERA